MGFLVDAPIHFHLLNCIIFAADPGGKLEKEVELRQAAEERVATAEHQCSLLQLELKKSKMELLKVEENLTSQQAMVSPAPTISQ